MHILTHENILTTSYVQEDRDIMPGDVPLGPSLCAKHTAAGVPHILQGQPMLGTNIAPRPSGYTRTENIQKYIRHTKMKQKITHTYL